MNNNTVLFIKNKILEHKEFLLYAIIGVTGVAIDFIIFYLLYNKLNADVVIANIISVSAGITNNFILNTFFNFKKKDRIGTRFFSFFTVGIAGLLLSNLIIFIFHSKAGLDATLVKFISIPPVVVFQFILNKKISFRDFSK